MGTHVVVDARMAWGQGIGRYVRNMVPRLARQTPSWRWTLLGDAPRLAAADWVAGLPNVRTATLAAPVYSVREQIEPLAAARGASVYWTPHYNAPVLARAPLVVTVHDVGHLRIPEFTRSTARRWYARAMLGATRRAASAMMCDSAFTRGEIESLFGAARCPTAVVHLGVDAAWFEPADGPPPIAEPYFVFVGDRKPYKNLPTLLAAFAEVSRSARCRLALVGRASGFRNPDARVQPLLASLGDRVVDAGEVDDEALRRWVGHAVALVQPSFYDGFGLPPLEAMAAGRPVIASRAGSLPEVCGEAALYFDPSDTAALTALMRSVLGDAALRQRAGDAGRAHARRFDWDASATAAQGVLESVAA